MLQVSPKTAPHANRQLRRVAFEADGSCQLGDVRRHPFSGSPQDRSSGSASEQTDELVFVDDLDGAAFGSEGEGLAVFAASA